MQDVMILLDLLGAIKPVIRNYKETNYKPVYQLLADTERQLLKTSNCLNSIPSIFGIADTWAAVDDDHVPFHKRGKFFFTQHKFFAQSCRNSRISPKCL